MHESSAIDRRIARLPPRWRWAAGAALLTLRDPADGLDRVLARIRMRTDTGPPAREAYAPDGDWRRHLHDELGVPWPCDSAAAFTGLRPRVIEYVREQGISLGRGAYGGWDDADPGFAEAVWCLTMHLRPLKVVETGVARGVTSRYILEAFERLGAGHLWSIDLPATDPTLHGEIGIAVPEGLRSRWTYLSGTSRRHLPKLLDAIGPIDLFIHDSSHTGRNVRFEIGHVWPALRPGGALIADDIHRSTAFASFASTLSAGTSIVAEADDGQALFGIARKPVQDRSAAEGVVSEGAASGAPRRPPDPGRVGSAPTRRGSP